MSLINGNRLSEDQRRQVLRAYVHRHLAIGPGRVYADDEAWLLGHAFHFTRQGRLDRRYQHCEPAYLNT